MKKLLFFILLFQLVTFCNGFAQWNKTVYDYGTKSGSTITLYGTSFNSYLTNGQQISAHIYSPIAQDSEEIALITYTTSSNTFTINSITQNYYGTTAAVSFPDTNVIVRYNFPLYISDGGTNLTSYTIGDLLYASAINKLSKRSLGTAGQVLKVYGGVPTWRDDSTGSGASGANPTASLGLTAINGSASTFMRSDAAPALDVSIAPFWTSLHSFSQAVGATSVDAIALRTTTAATNGNPKFSPGINFLGNVWSVGLGASENANFRIDNEPNQAVPTGNLVFSSSMNGGSYTPRLTIGSNGHIIINEFVGTIGLPYVPAVDGILQICSPSNGDIIFGTGGSPDFNNQLKFDKTNNTLQVGGGIESQLVTKTGNYTATLGDSYILCNGTSTAFTVTLPAASTCNGLQLNIKKTDNTGHAITISRASSDTIEGSTTISLASQYNCYTLVSDGASVWYIIGQH